MRPFWQSLATRARRTRLQRDFPSRLRVLRSAPTGQGRAMPDANQPQASEIAGSTGPAARVGLLAWARIGAGLSPAANDRAGLGSTACAGSAGADGDVVDHRGPAAGGHSAPAHLAVPLIGIDVGADGAGRLVCATEGLCQAAPGRAADQRAAAGPRRSRRALFKPGRAALHRRLPDRHRDRALGALDADCLRARLRAAAPGRG